MKMESSPCKLARPFRLENPIQTYAWGSHTHIQTLMGRPPTAEPWAEMWMGAHPAAPSRLTVNGDQLTLDALIRQCPEQALGKNTSETYHHALPYLFKLLAAERPLSIQAHPDSVQAERGFARENRRGLPLSDPARNYRDSCHKPECICALTPFTGLKGFRKKIDILDHLSRLCPKALGEEIHLLQVQGLKPFFEALMTLPPVKKTGAVREAVGHAGQDGENDPVNAWILALFREYPDDIGVILPAVLNLFQLAPKEALFLPAGELHAYLDGFGIEVMANSDNVLRGGLTPKHVDVPELMNVLNFCESDIAVLGPSPVSATLSVYPSWAEEFTLSVIGVTDAAPHVEARHGVPEILICTEGAAELSAGNPATTIRLESGASVFLPASVTGCTITGNATFYKAGVPA